MTIIAKLAILLLLPLLAEEEAPSPEDRVAEMKKECAAGRAALAGWAEGKKLKKAALAHYRIARNLDPECRKAKSRLKDEKRDWSDGKGAWKKHGEALGKRESDLNREEATAFEKLGLELIKEGRADLGRPLCLRAHFLDPTSVGAAKGLDLVPFAKAFARPEVAEALRGAPAAGKADIAGVLARWLGTKTTVRQCDSCLAETMGDKAAADAIARVVHQGQVFTSMNFGLPAKGKGWVVACVTGSREQFNRLVDAVGMQEPGASFSKALGNFRIGQPRHCLATFAAETGDPKNSIPLFLHYIGENVVWWEAGQGVPSWLMEAVGLDANLMFVGAPGPTCVTFEESAGITKRDNFEDHGGWSRLLVRRAALGDLPRMELLLRAQIQALGPEDIIASHAYYRWLRLERRSSLANYLRNLAAEQVPETAFENAFGMRPEAMTRKLTALLTGG